MRTVLVGVFAALALTAAAAASHPELDRMDRVRYLAHEIEQAARHVHKQAERDAHHFTRAEDRALASLHHLDKKARHFHREVERHHRDPYHTEADFRALVDAFSDARYQLSHLHAYRHVRQDFHRVEVLMGELVGYYGYGPGHGYGERRYGPYPYDPGHQYGDGERWWGPYPYEGHPPRRPGRWGIGLWLRW